MAEQPGESKLAGESEPQAQFKPRGNGPFFLGIDVGGTNIKTGVVSATGDPLSKVKVKTQADEGPQQGVANIVIAAKQAIEEAGLTPSEIHSIGLATPGPMDIKGGRLLTPANLPSWHDMPIRDQVAGRLGRPTVLQNDANAAAYGEYWTGAAKHARSLVFWTLGTGIGCGIIYNGEIIEGSHSHGSECGHIIVQMEGGRVHPGTHQAGVLEAYAAARALVSRAEEALRGGRSSSLNDRLAAGEELNPRLIGAEAEAGDELALELVLDTARYMAVGIVSIMHTIDPEMMLIGGAMTFGANENPLGRQFLETIRSVVRQRAFPACAQNTLIDFATLGSDAGFIGAAGCAKKAFA